MHFVEPCSCWNGKKMILSKLFFFSQHCINRQKISVPIITHNCNKGTKYELTQVMIVLTAYT